MAKRQENNNIRLYRPPTENRLSIPELHELDRKLQGYVIERETEKFGKIKFIDTQRWLIDKGGLSKDEGIIITCFQKAIYNQRGDCEKPHDCDPILYEQLMTDYEQWGNWKGRKKYAQGKELEELQKFSEQVWKSQRDF